MLYDRSTRVSGCAAVASTSSSMKLTVVAVLPDLASSVSGHSRGEEFGSLAFSFVDEKF